MEVDKLSDEDIEDLAADRARKCVEDALTAASEAARIILDGVRADRWRILIGVHAEELDQRLRQDVENVYMPEFYKSAAERWAGGGPESSMSFRLFPAVRFARVGGANASCRAHLLHAKYTCG
ncbi:hypothetical protein [Bradyrhizobium glycinis]|uniref:hypothetical protein n=1 Tax=Bradyrhizobium glycinis TaxID=2751812 RepID=UPI0018D5EA93|nr:hypothetical protein [Bradyrhizobium glycinis]MBH5371587.1 hypothetical protein [Bradyrhizobium glycinis]